MPVIQFPYGREHLELQISEERHAGTLVSQMHHYVSDRSEMELVRAALEHPIGTPRLREMCRGKNKIVIIASDHTRPVPSKIIAPLLLAEIREGNPDADITFLVSTGCHRCTSEEELVDKFGSEIVQNEKIYIHDCDDESMLMNVGTLPSGGELILNRMALEADLLVAEGFIEPHFFAGFSGGRKSVLPGVAARKTVINNHNAAFIDHPNARTGVLEENPIHMDMLYAARMARLDFICNVVINADKKVICAVAGDLEQAHAKGREFLCSQCMVESNPSDIVITTNGGYPLDQNIYQAVKGMTAAEATVNPGGVIIMLASSTDGHGGEDLYRRISGESDLNKTMSLFLSRGRNDTVPDQWQTQILLRVLKKAKVIYISDMPDDIIEKMHLIPAHSLEQAIKMAKELIGKDNATITAIPDGVSVIVK